VYFGYLLTFFITILFVLIYKRLAHHSGLVDRPDSRKNHEGHIPLVGGLAIFSSILLSPLFARETIDGFGVFLACICFLLVMGLFDDVLEIKASLRILAQIIAAAFMVFVGGVVLVDFGNISPSGLFVLGGFSVFITIFSIVGTINAVNFSDGLDGLAGGLVLIYFSFFAIVTALAERWAELEILLLLISALLGFLMFNARWVGRKKAAVFLGDSGSMCLGFAVAWFAIDLTQGDDRVVTPVTVLWFFALPLFDTVGVMLRRILKSQSPLVPDRGHLHHIFEHAGFSVGQTVLIIHALALLMASIGLFAWYLKISEFFMFALFILIFALFFWGMMYAWKSMMLLRGVAGH
jgi:UDP-GlcNAc:undecaprenyl-phosphate GlcNAc-1-phosphate transferase